MRFLRFNRTLQEVFDSHGKLERGIGHVAFEEVRRHIGTDAAHVYGGMMATLTRFCEENQIPYEGIPVGTIKKHIAGKGNASKDDVISAVNFRFGLNHSTPVVDDNEADALAIAHYVASLANIKFMPPIDTIVSKNFAT